jgi:WD40 repeat protein
VSSNINPFPGLRPFEAKESHLFFGREAHTSEILRKLETFRFVSVVGNSGSGKSSLVKAGVLPELEHSDNDWRICSLRPGNAPIDALAHALVDLNLAANNVDTVSRLLNKSKLGLIQHARTDLPANARLLILVDQFEELFRFHALDEDEDSFKNANHFVQLILAAAEQKDVPIYIMITLRSDFLGDSAQFMGLPEALNDGQFLVPRMRKEELKSSFTGPIDQADATISPRLVQQLLNEVDNDPDQLPILQHLLMRTWEVWEKEKTIGLPLDIPHYTASGGMKNALSNHAEEAYAELKNDKQRRIAKLLFQTVTVKGTDNRGVRRPTPLNKIAEICNASVKEVIEVVEHFRRQDRGFLMPPQGVNLSGDSILDISHESLMRVWGRLKDWVDEEGESSILYARITDSAKGYEMERAGLWRDPDLQISLDWLTKYNPNNAWASQYNDSFDSSIRFIEASKQEKKFVLADKLRKRRLRNASVFLILIVLSVLSVWAIKERNSSDMYAQSAIEERNIADKHKTVAEENLAIAKEQEELAQQQQKEAENQKRLALISALEAKKQRTLAEQESLIALKAQSQAEYDRQVAENQKTIADSLRQISVVSEQNSTRLRLLALSQNLAIKSKVTASTNDVRDLKALLAIQAYKWNQQYGGKEADMEILGALFAAKRAYQKSSDYLLKYHSDYVNAIAYNQKDELVSAGNDGYVIVSYDKILPAYLKSPPHSSILDNIYYNSSGNMMALTNSNNDVIVYGSKNVDAPVKKFSHVHRKEIIALQWGQKHILSASLDSTIHVLNLEQEKIERTIELDFRPLSMCYLAELGLVFIGGNDGKIYKTDLNGSNGITEFLDPEKGEITAISTNKARNYVAFGTRDGYCGLVHVNDPNCLEAVSGHTRGSGISQVSFHPTKPLLATACLDRKVRLYETTDLNMPPMIFDENTDWVLDIAFTADGNTLTSGGKDKSIRKFPINQQEIIGNLEELVKRNLSKEEWSIYIGNDIPYSKTVPSL